MVTLTTRAKNWLAINAGVNNCFSPGGVTYTDPDGVVRTESTSQVLNAFWTAHQVGKDTVIIIAGTDYIGFTTINGQVDIDLTDIDWAFNNDGHGGLPQYCAPPAHIISTELIVNSACSPDPCSVDAAITWTNDGALPGSFSPGVVVDGVLTTLSSEPLAAGAFVSHGFTISGLTIAENPHLICASPGPHCQSVTVFQVVDICNWITSIGGWTAITAYHIMTLVRGYLGQISLGYTVTMAHINGAIAYYLGIKDSGNMFTGCMF